MLLITMREAAELLSVCERTIFNLCRSGALTFVKIGSSKRILLKSVEEFIASRLLAAKVASEDGNTVEPSK